MLFGPPGTMTTLTPQGYTVNPDQTPFHETTEGIAQKQAYIEQNAIVENPAPQPSSSPTSTKVNQIPAFPGVLNIQPATQPKNNAGLTQANFLSDWWSGGGLGDLFGFLGDITSWGNFQSPIAIPQMDFWNNPLFGQTLESFNPFPGTTEAMGNWDLGGLFEMGSFGNLFGDLSSNNFNFGDLSMDFSSMFSQPMINQGQVDIPSISGNQPIPQGGIGLGYDVTPQGIMPTITEVEPGVWAPKSNTFTA